MKKKEIVDVLTRIAANITELSNLLKDPADDQEQTVNARSTAKEKKDAIMDEQNSKAPITEAAEEISFEKIRSILAQNAADGCRQKVKELIKEYHFSCLSDIEKHPELYSEILEKARAM